MIKLEFDVDSKRALARVAEALDRCNSGAGVRFVFVVILNLERSRMGKDPRIGAGTDAMRTTNVGFVSLCIRAGTNDKGTAHLL